MANETTCEHIFKYPEVATAAYVIRRGIALDTIDLPFEIRLERATSCIDNKGWRIHRLDGRHFLVSIYNVIPDRLKGIEVLQLPANIAASDVHFFFSARAALLKPRIFDAKIFNFVQRNRGWFQEMEEEISALEILPELPKLDFSQPTTPEIPKDSCIILSWTNLRKPSGWPGQSNKTLYPHTNIFLRKIIANTPSFVSLQIKLGSQEPILGGVRIGIGNEFYYSQPQLSQGQELSICVGHNQWKKEIDFFKYRSLVHSFDGVTLPSAKSYLIGYYLLGSDRNREELECNLTIHAKHHLSENSLQKHSIPHVGRFVPGTTTADGPRLTYCGHTLNGKTVWRDQDGQVSEKLVVNPPTPFPGLVHYCTDTSVPPPGVIYKSVNGAWRKNQPMNDADQQLLARLNDKMHEYLLKITIRGISLLELFVALSDRNGVGYPLAIVGGSVRDVLKEVEPDDVDIVVGGHYKELEDYLRDFLIEKGESVGKNTLFTKEKSKQFGQMKIMKVEGEKQPLDIALFKAERVEDPKDSKYQDKEGKDKVECQYLFGYSYQKDAQYRDYTVNALYFQLFPWPALIDPTGHGFKDIQDKRLQLASEIEFEFDFGGQLRFWKMKFKTNEFTQVDENDVQLVNGYLLAHVNKLGSNDAADVKYSSYVDFFKKLRSKLFKKPTDLAEFHRKITEDEHVQALPSNWWTAFINKAQSFTYPEDEQLNTELMLMIEDIKSLNPPSVMLV